MPELQIGEIRQKLTARMAELLEIPPEEIDPQKPFTQYGLDSMAAVGVTGELEDWYGEQFPADLLAHYSSIEALSQYLFQLLNPSVGDA